MIDVAVLDSGINTGFFDGLDCIGQSIDFSENNGSMVEYKSSNIITHGTICAAIIKKYSPTVIIHNVRVVTQNDCNPINLVNAIRYCINQNIKIVNISLGVNCFNKESELKNVVAEAVDNGMLFIASTHKAGIITYPACYKDVISVGVNLKLHLNKCNIIVNQERSAMINVFASGIQRLTKFNKLICITENEPSYATAVVTGVVCNQIIKDNIQHLVNRNSVLDSLCNVQDRSHL
jgi:hypothetical protein